MPISKERQKLYPGGSIRSPEWLSIRAEILERERHRCAFCKVRDRAIISRDRRHNTYIYTDKRFVIHPETKVYSGNSGRIVDRTWFEWQAFGDYPLMIVLTIAHLDQDPTNNGEPGNRPNLAALCQKCHNAHDAPHRAAHARQTRLRNKPLPLFDGKD